MSGQSNGSMRHRARSLEQPAGSSGPLPAGGVAAVERALSPQERAELQEAFRRTLAGGVHGLCFSPYLEGQAPGARVSEAQIRARLEIIRPHVRWVRTFSCTDGHEHTPRIAHELGLQTLVGAWLGKDRDKNEREIDGVVAIASAGHADLVAVGNEVLLREDLPEDELVAYLQRVRQALPGVPVGYVDAYYQFEDHPRVTAACDVVLVNCYPFWEGASIKYAGIYLQEMYNKVKAISKGKDVIVTETGWPAQGEVNVDAEPSAENQMLYFLDVRKWADMANIDLFYFSSFDESWKVHSEGWAGTSWGLWDENEKLKFVN